MMLAAKVLVVWLLQLAAVVTFGAIRERFLTPLLGEQRAHQVGTVAACCAVFAVICVSLGWIGPPSPWHALGLGAIWVVLALTFELGFFHYVAKVPWSRLLADYNLARGRLLVLLWVTVLLSPVVCLLVSVNP